MVCYVICNGILCYYVSSCIFLFSLEIVCFIIIGINFLNRKFPQNLLQNLIFFSFYKNYFILIVFIKTIKIKCMRIFFLICVDGNSLLVIKLKVVLLWYFPAKAITAWLVTCCYQIGMMLNGISSKFQGGLQRERKAGAIPSWT